MSPLKFRCPPLNASGVDYHSAGARDIETVAPNVLLPTTNAFGAKQANPNALNGYPSARIGSGSGIIGLRLVVTSLYT